MRLVIQRVADASVTVDGDTTGKIDNGLLILIGVKDGDTKESVEILAKKVSRLRVMSDEKGKMNLSVGDKKDSVLVVSQFTLYADTTKGNRPSFMQAADPDKAEELYNLFVAKLKECGINVQTGRFGAYMTINANLDGPVTILIDNE